MFSSETKVKGEEVSIQSGIVHFKTLSTIRNAEKQE